MIILIHSMNQWLWLTNRKRGPRYWLRVPEGTRAATDTTAQPQFRSELLRNDRVVRGQNRPRGSSGVQAPQITPCSGIIKLEAVAQHPAVPYRPRSSEHGGAQGKTGAHRTEVADATVLPASLFYCELGRRSCLSQYVQRGSSMCWFYPLPTFSTNLFVACHVVI